MEVGKFIRSFSISNGRYLLCKGAVASNNFHYVNNLNIEGNYEGELFFTPAQFKKIDNADEAQKGKREDVLGTRYLWVDVDNEKLLPLFLPPTFIIFSGHGYHLYYLLEEVIYDLDLIEQLNKLLIIHTPHADNSTWNVNRFLRVPNSLNTKRKPYKRVEIKKYNSISYSVADIQVLRNINKKTKHKVITGDSRGFKSRSERDFNVIQNLVKAGATDNLIHLLFNNHSVGDKAKEAHESYLPRTINKVRATLPNTNSDNVTGIISKEDGYYYATSKSETRISTFTIEPLLLIDGSTLGKYDSIICNVHCIGQVWGNITFTKQAFTTIRALDKECLNVHWQWLGNEGHLRKLLPLLLEELTDKGLPSSKGIPYTGLYKNGSGYYFIGTDKVITADKTYNLLDSPVTWLPDKSYVGNTNLCFDCHHSQVKRVGKYLPKLNNPDVIWVMIGWYSISLLKPYLEDIGRRLPILSVTGTKGSGKTTLIKLFMSLMGQDTPKTYDSNTTRFVTLKLLGSSYSLPIAFSEFRYEAVQNFLRFILLAYDTGLDARGNANQTITTYPLIAPFSIDGEDMLIDPAVKERIVTAKLNANTVIEGSEAYKAFKTFIKKLPANFGGKYIKYLLNLLKKDDIIHYIDKAEKALIKTFPQNMPDRIRNNHTLVLAGCFIFCDFVKINYPNPLVMERSITSVYNLTSQRAKLLVDDFVEYIINSIVLDSAKFNYKLSDEGIIIYFQLATAYPSWIIQQKKQGGTVLEREAIRTQLQEVSYYLGMEVKNDILMYKVNISKAKELGLDIPNKITVKRITNNQPLLEWI